MITMARRNVKLFFRDRPAAFFSILSVFIIIGLYALFLGDNMLNSFQEGEGIKTLVNSWVVAGILAVVSITTTLAAFGIMVEDKSKKISKDFNCAPIKRSQLAGGYIIGGFVVGMFMSIVTLVIAEIYIVLTGGELLSFVNMLKVLGIMLIAVLSGSAMMFFVVTFFKSLNAFSTACTIVGTLIGFIVGIYVPIGSLPNSVQFVMKIFPTTHAGALYRQVFTEAPMAVTFANAPLERLTDFNIELGVILKFGDTAVSNMMSVLYLIATAIVFFGLSVLVISRKNKGK